jgi:hypothetical protein
VDRPLSRRARPLPGHEGGLDGAAGPPRPGRAQEGRGQNQLGLRGKRRPTHRHCRPGLPGLFFGYVLPVHKYKQTNLHLRPFFPGKNSIPNMLTTPPSARQPDNTCRIFCLLGDNFYFSAVLRIRIRRIRIFLGLLDPDPSINTRFGSVSGSFYHQAKK